MVDGKFSDKVPVETGVPQGSVIGPILFSLYLLPLFDVLNENNIPYRFYADDSQLFIEITSQKDNFLVFGKDRRIMLSAASEFKQEKDDNQFLWKTA